MDRRSLWRLTLGTILALVGATIVTPLAAASSQPPAGDPRPDPATQARDQAAMAAASFVAGLPPVLRAGPEDAFIAHPVVSSAGVQFVPYDRTYRGVSVVGGDFVLVYDKAGRLSTASVALKKPISGLSVTPTLTAAAAEKVARAQLTSVSQVESSTLVVYALGVAPRLAYESIVDGVGRAGMSRLSVYVDALTGSVITTREHVVDGSGTGAYNGPSPLDIPTLVTIEPPNFPTYYLKDPRTGNLQCGGVVNGPLFVDSDDVWGDGHAQEEETACVDAMFAAQTEVRMLSAWLGRNAMDGSGSAWPILVGINEVNAFYTGTQVRIGHNTAGLSLASLDVVGHEMGHGVDDNTPVGSRGLSGGSTQEFIADVFGALTEWYANEPAAFDPPDFQIGEKADPFGAGAIRYMYNPALVGDPACYSDTIPTSEVHAGAGPGDHWFYLLAMGSNPNGQPTSPTCNNKTVTGVGIQTAAQILYNAMLMKTSDSSYLTYRTGTLTAAKDLTPGDCTAFRATRAAWNAVSVPEQTGDPTCHDLFVFNPGSVSGTRNVAVSMAMAASGGTRPYGWSATGLPTGLSIDPATGVVSGTPTTAGAFTPVVTVTDSSDPPEAASQSFTWTINDVEMRLFFGTATAAKPTLAQIRATTIAKNRATAAGFGHCELFGDPEIDLNEDGTYTATVTMSCQRL